MNEDEILQAAIDRWGVDHQVRLATEECGELIVSLCHSMRNRPNNVPEEIADVKIMLRQMEVIFSCKEEVELISKEKICRLQSRLLDAERKEIG